MARHYPGRCPRLISSLVSEHPSDRGHQDAVDLRARLCRGSRNSGAEITTKALSPPWGAALLFSRRSGTAFAHLRCPTRPVTVVLGDRTQTKSKTRSRTDRRPWDDSSLGDSQILLTFPLDRRTLTREGPVHRTPRLCIHAAPRRGAGDDKVEPSPGGHSRCDPDGLTWSGYAQAKASDRRTATAAPAPGPTAESTAAGIT